MKNLSKLGNSLSKVEQKAINGGGFLQPNGHPNAPYIEMCTGPGASVGNICFSDANCCPGEHCGTTYHPTHSSSICMD